MSANNNIGAQSKSNTSNLEMKQSTSGIVILNKGTTADVITKKKENSLMEDKRVRKQANKSSTRDTSASRIDFTSKQQQKQDQKNKSEDVLPSKSVANNRSIGFASSTSRTPQEGQTLTGSKLTSIAAAAPPGSYLEKARQPKVNVERQVKQSSAAQPQVMTKKKHRPTETLELDLLTLALQAKKKEEERKQHQARQFHHRSSGAAAAAAAAREKDAEPGEKKIGKVRGAGEIARRKNRLSSLKKRILQERRARWWLLHPDVQPFPLVSHPALIEHECIWLNQSRPSTSHEYSKNDSEEENDVSSLSNESSNEDDESLSDECPEEEVDVNSDEDQESVEEEEDDQEANQHAAATSKEKNQDDKVNLHRAATGSIPFDPLSASPIYFGAFYRRLPPNTASPAAGLPDNNHQNTGADVKSKSSKKGPRPLPNARPVRDYVTQALSKQLDELCLQMLAQLFKYQERARAEDPVNAKLRRRLVMGLHEVRRGVRSHRCIAVVIVPNVEDAEGLDEKLEEILRLCNENNTNQDDNLWRPVPVIFASNKRHLGRALGKRAAVSCVGIYSADGAHEQFKQCLKLAEKLGGFWKSQVAEELRLAGLGRRMTCASCLSVLEGSVRRDCLNCKRTFCEPCASRSVAKKEACIISTIQDSSSTVIRTCEIVRVARTAPKVARKSLSVGAKEFVPPVLLHPPTSSSSPEQTMSPAVAVVPSAGVKTTLKLNPAAEEYKPPPSSSSIDDNEMLRDGNKTVV